MEHNKEGKQKGMKVKLKALIFVILLVVTASVVLFRKPSDKSFNQELESYKTVYQESDVIFLRKALDAYLENDSSKACILQVAVTKTDEKEYGVEGIISGLESFDKGYYKSKFVVATFGDNKEIEGSKDIQIIFKDRPDRIFYAWIGNNPQGETCLLGFNSKNEIDPEKLREMLKSTEPYFSDPNLAI